MDLAMRIFSKFRQLFFTSLFSPFFLVSFLCYDFSSIQYRQFRRTFFYKSNNCLSHSNPVFINAEKRSLIFGQNKKARSFLSDLFFIQCSEVSLFGRGGPKKLSQSFYSDYISSSHVKRLF